MYTTFLPLVDWNLGMIGTIFMFTVFLGLIIVLLILMYGKKKENNR